MYYYKYQHIYPKFTNPNKSNKILLPPKQNRLYKLTENNNFYYKIYLNHLK